MAILTLAEQESIMEHLGYADDNSFYVNVTLKPALQKDYTPERLARVRGHLAKLDGLYTQLAEASEDFGLDSAKNIQFSRAAEARLAGMHAFWAEKLATSLNVWVSSSPAIGGHTQRRIL